MIELILKAIYFFLPAFIANSVPVYAHHFNWLPNFAKPIDFGKKINKKRILGDNKTFRGFIIGIISSFLVGILQFTLFNNFQFIKDISLTNNYQYLFFSISLAVFQGFGALVGDSIKSFIKRQFDIAPGKPWIGPDQIDYIIGGIIFSLPFVLINYDIMLTLLIVGTILHFLSNVTLKIIGVRDKWL